MRRFLVVSYDDDQQQWFYDSVFSTTADGAVERVLTARPYAIDADATPLHELTRMSRKLAKTTRTKSEEHLATIAKESGEIEEHANRDAAALAGWRQRK